MTSKFEQLIEFVINDEEAKAKELFHDIVVEKSREIYENLMNEEEAEEELDEAAEEESEEEELDENMMGSDDLIDEVETEEQGMQEDESDAEFDDTEMDHDEGNETEHDIEDRVVDLEDKLDELMAEFESLMGAEAGEEHGDAVSDMDGGDALEMDDTDTEEFMPEMGMMEEGIELTKVAPAKMGDNGVNTKSPVACNSGAAGMASKPVSTTGGEAKGRPAPAVGSATQTYQNAPASGSKKMSPATKPVTTQAAGVNTKTPFPKG
jgi:hypothetical protein